MPQENSNPVLAAAIVTTIGGIIVAAITIIPQVTKGGGDGASTTSPTATTTTRSTPRTTAPTSPDTGDPVDLQGLKSAVPATVSLLVTVHRPPAVGRVYWLVIKLDGVDPANPHSEYYGRRQLPSSPAPAFRLNLNFGNDSYANLQRTAQVYAVPAAQAKWLQQDADSGGQAATVAQRVQPPCHDCEASPAVPVAFH